MNGNNDILFNIDELEAFSRATGKESERFLQLLATHKKLKDAFETETGKLISQDLIDMLQKLMGKIISGNLSDSELKQGEITCPSCNAKFPIGLIRIYAKYEFALELMTTWGNKIKSYTARSRKVKEIARKQMSEERINA